MRGTATGPDTAVPGCDEADDLGLAALPQWPLSGSIRDKTHPARMLVCPNRYKTRPAHTPSTPTGTKLARHTRRPPQPGQNSPGTHAGPPQPVQNSPYTAKIAHFAPFSACRAKNVTLSAQALAAGRLFSRCGFEQSKLGDLCRATSGSFAHGALHLHRNHLLGPRKARAGTHTAFMSTMSHGDWDALKEISPLLGIAPAGMKYKSPLLA